MLVTGEGTGSRRWYAAGVLIDGASGVFFVGVGGAASSRFYIGGLVCPCVDVSCCPPEPSPIQRPRLSLTL